MNSKYGQAWSHNELVLALYLYCQIPFARTKANNPEVIRLASLIGRTPSSVARKLGNFGAFDPLLSKQGISGLSHGSKLDREIWNTFLGKWDSLVIESLELLTQLHAAEFPLEQENAPIISRPKGPTERQSTVTTRLCQSFFRRAVLSSYESSCCVCGIDLPQLLVASHIVPWSINKEIRTDPENGLCLCSLHDKAFDRGLISLQSSLEIIISSEVRSSKSEFLAYSIAQFHGQRIKLPRRFPPNVEYIQWHFENVYSNFGNLTP